MNTFKVRRSLAAIVVGAVCAGVGVLGLASPALARDAVWLESSSRVIASPGRLVAHLGEKDAVWL